MYTDEPAPPSKMEVFFRACAYLVAAVMGVFMLLEPPLAVKENIMFVFTILTGVAMFVGGVAAMFAAAQFKYRTEYIFLPMITGGVAVFGIASWAYAGSNYPVGVMSAFAATVLVLKFLARFCALHRLVRMHTLYTAGNNETASDNMTG